MTIEQTNSHVIALWMFDLISRVERKGELEYSILVDSLLKFTMNEFPLPSLTEIESQTSTDVYRKPGVVISWWEDPMSQPSWFWPVLMLKYILNVKKNRINPRVMPSYLTFLARYEKIIMG